MTRCGSCAYYTGPYAGTGVCTRHARPACEGQAKACSDHADLTQVSAGRGGGSMTYTCDVCRREFASMHALKIHKARAHKVAGVVLEGPVQHLPEPRASRAVMPEPEPVDADEYDATDEIVSLRFALIRAAIETSDVADTVLPHLDRIEELMR